MDEKQKAQLTKLQQRFAQSVSEFERLQSLLKDISSGTLSEQVLSEIPELSEKYTTNEKLKYRIGIMKRAIEEAKSQPPNQKADGKANGNCSGTNNKQNKVNGDASKVAPAKNNQQDKPMQSDVKYVKVNDFQDAVLEKLQATFSDVVNKVKVNVLLRETSNPKFGDYQFDSCIAIAKKLALKPDEVARAVMDNLPPLDLVKSVELAKVFINIHLNRETVGRKVAAIFERGIKLPSIRKRRVVIDFSSPNIAKQMHVGHLRSTIIGESFSRLLEYVGFDESKKRFDEDEQFKARAYQCVVKLQGGVPEFINAWKLICDVSRKDYTRVYERLDVTIQDRGESFYQDKMLSLVAELEKQGQLVTEEGRKLFWPQGANIPLTVVKSDGGYTYDTSDLATIKQRIFEEKANWLLYVVDRGQSEHFETIYAAARDLGWYEPRETRVEHVQFGVVLGEDRKKFKTRSGDTVRLTDLLDEGVKRAEAKLKEKNRDQVMSAAELAKARDAVAYGCIRYADLSHDRTNDYIFSYDRMLDDRGNTAVYLLYAYARIRSIAREAQVSRDQVAAYVAQLPQQVLPLGHEREFKLAKQLLKFSDVLLAVLESLQLHKLCDYVYGLATVFHDFYKDCYVIHKADGQVTINFHRLVLCEVTADTMQTCFHILGIRPIDRM